ncbi:hypothetical protein [Sphaerobacter thermophilus]|jgi:hypothetical protein|nr:hypothetical protein [Sphaerobacter thermophilus]
MSDGPAVRAEELVTRAMRYVTWSGYFALFALATLIFGLIAACFVPTDWVVTRKDYVYLQMHPRGVLDLAEDYEQFIATSQKDPIQNQQWRERRQHLWVNYWLRWGTVMIVVGAVTLGLDRLFGRRVSVRFVAALFLAFTIAIGIYLVTHPGFNPLV